MKNLVVVFIISFITILFFSNYFSKKSHNKIIPSYELSFSFVGDLMCHLPILESAKVETDSFDFNPIFDEIKDELSKSDFTIGNLETTIAGKELRYSGYPNFNSPIEFLSALKNAGFDVMFTCNNHALDRGIIGIQNTIQNIKKVGLKFVGTKVHKDDEEFLILEKNNIKVALLAYTYGLNGNILPSSKKFMINIIDTAKIKNEILIAKKISDVIIVYLHFGEEYERTPNKNQKILVEKIFEYGGNIVIGSHPHVIQPLEFINQDKFVAFSLGNFLSNQRWKYTDTGVILNFTISKNNSNKIQLKNFSYIPTIVFKGQINKKLQYKIIKADTTNYPLNLTSNDKLKIKDLLKDMKSFINN